LARRPSPLGSAEIRPFHSIPSGWASAPRRQALSRTASQVCCLFRISFQSGFPLGGYHGVLPCRVPFQINQPQIRTNRSLLTNHSASPQRQARASVPPAGQGRSPLLRAAGSPPRTSIQYSGKSTSRPTEQSKHVHALIHGFSPRQCRTASVINTNMINFVSIICACRRRHHIRAFGTIDDPFRAPAVPRKGVRAGRRPRPLALAWRCGLAAIFSERSKAPPVPHQEFLTSK
jgi:hypothetical protein